MDFVQSSLDVMSTFTKNWQASMIKYLKKRIFYVIVECKHDIELSYVRAWSNIKPRLFVAFDVFTCALHIDFVTIARKGT